MNEKTNIIDEILKEKKEFQNFLDENIEVTETTISFDLSKISKNCFNIQECNAENLQKLIS